MCTNPLTIRSPKKFFNPDADPTYYQVPCNHCAQCQSVKASAWSVRSYYEWRNCKDNGGVALYITLTYAPQSLPYCDIPTSDGDTLTVPCFFKPDIQKFLQRLRKYCQRHYDCDVRYIITSEYGGKKHRPHYHGILYFSKNLYSYLIKQLVKKYWSFGFVSFGKYGGIVKSPSAANYVCKYITKDFDFSGLLSKIGFNKDNIQYELYKSHRRRIFPFHLQSVGYGEALIKYNDFALLYEGKCIAYNKENQPIVISLPLYHVRKLFYTLDENKTYVPTPLGLRMLIDKKRSTYNESLERLSLQIQSYRDLLKDVFTDNDIRQICSSLGMPASRSCLISKVNAIEYKGIDKFHEYVTNQRFYLRVSDVKSPHHVQLSAVDRIRVRFDDSIVNDVSRSKYVNLRELSASEFQAVSYKTHAYSHPLEDLAKVIDAIRQHIGILANEEYEKELELESTNKLLITYDFE